jgi:hypothetical protein
MITTHSLTRPDHHDRCFETTQQPLSSLLHCIYYLDTRPARNWLLFIYSALLYSTLLPDTPLCFFFLALQQRILHRCAFPAFVLGWEKTGQKAKGDLVSMLVFPLLFLGKHWRWAATRQKHRACATTIFSLYYDSEP